MEISRRQLVELGISALSIGAITTVSGCSSAGDSLLIGGYQTAGSEFGIGALDTSANLSWKLPTRARMHGLAAHQRLPLAAVAARRPGDHIVLFDPLKGTQLGQLQCPDGCFLEGHVEFSDDQLWATAAEKSSSKGYLLSWPLYALNWQPESIVLPGLGPHQIIRGQDKQLWIAMGGWQTEQRKVLNADSFHSFLLNINTGTSEIKQVSSPAKALSLRHLAFSNGELFAAMQYPNPHPSEQPLIYRLKENQWQALAAPKSGWQAFKGYIASIAVNSQNLIATSPQGHQLGLWRRADLSNIDSKTMLDVAAATNLNDRLVVSAGTGLVAGLFDELSSNKLFLHKNALRSELHWDNHWIGYALS